jgi:hypothetical protein
MPWNAACAVGCSGVITVAKPFAISESLWDLCALCLCGYLRNLRVSVAISVLSVPQ